MNYSVLISNQAKEDLRGIYAYIAYQLLSPAVAKKLLLKLEETIKSLETFPMRCHVMFDNPWKDRGFRVLQVDNYLLIYSVEEKLHEVTIIRVLYAKRDIPKALE